MYSQIAVKHVKETAVHLNRFFADGCIYDARGVLLLNLGTPNSPSVKDVRIYLREFLNDPRVIDIGRLAQ